MCNFCNNAQFISSSPGWHWWLLCFNWVDQEYAVTHFYTCKHSWIFPKAPDFFWVSWKPKSTNDRSVWNQNWVNLKIKNQPMTRQIWENQDQNQLKIWSSDWIESDNFQVSNWSVPGVLNQESVTVQGCLVERNKDRKIYQFLKSFFCQRMCTNVRVQIICLAF